MSKKTEIREMLPVSVEILTDGTDPQFLRLEDGYLAEIGEEPLDEKKQERLAKAVAKGDIVFFVARQEGRAVGMCSVAAAFSTFACSRVGQFEDFYVEPSSRKKGIARLLSGAARRWCREREIASLTVTCAPCDEGMYRALGFDAPLGVTLACIG